MDQRKWEMTARWTKNLISCPSRQVRAMVSWGKGLHCLYSLTYLSLINRKVPGVNLERFAEPRAEE